MRAAAELRVGFLGPEGTFSHAAALRARRAWPAAELVSLATIYDVIVAVQNGRVQRGVVPVENSIEGSVSMTLDALAIDAPDVQIIGEHVEVIEQCLIAAADQPLEAIHTVLSHPQPTAQCAHFLHDRLGHAHVLSASSTADAVRQVTERGAGWAALGPRGAAERYGATVLAAGVEDRAHNETRFVWIAAEPGPSPTPGPTGAAKTSIVFWGDGTGRPGWLVRCLSELSERGVNLTRIESRPRKLELGLYMFFVDCEGDREDPDVADGLRALAAHTEVLRILGSYAAG
ncbi:prephenate dehydratase [Conexibacter sp. DBS9H8]|uniref:prephenate dehydratase n=1 Tax=Conexibacter sp. DBS9H8 TaxID=2937801 RepID=UPI00200F0F51|nr:prephenate dehydratase [Conexibacter sp. DBS9H8]